MEFYSRRVLDHFLHPRNPGPMDAPDAVGRSCDEPHQATYVLHLRVRNGRVEDARFQAQGCVATIAASSALTVVVQGRTLEEARRISSADLLEELDGMPESKCFSLEASLRALHEALDSLEAVDAHA
ncbi:MAG: iron-sulfur cluster assembly scaffold protein [Pseudomonadota bacterium]